jgi:hypothetical protein
MQSFGVNLNYPYFSRWMPDGSGIAVRAADDKGRMGIYRIDITNGAASLVPNGSGTDALRMVAGRQNSTPPDRTRAPRGDDRLGGIWLPN